METQIYNERSRVYPVYTGMSLSLRHYSRHNTNPLRMHENEFATPQLPKYVSFLTNIDQKVLSAKMRLSKMVHTGFVAKVQDEGKH